MEMNTFLLFGVLLIGKVQLQTTSLSKDNSPYQCDSNLVLKCVVSGTSCCGNIKTWRKDGTILATSTDPKYSQDLFPTSNYFSLTIHDVVESDLGATYSCQYGVATQSDIKVDGSIHCNICGGWCFLWVLIGVIAATLGFVVFVKVKGEWTSKKQLVTFLVSILISLVVAGVVAIPVCIVNKLCKESPRLDPLFILLGFFVEIIAFYIVCVCYDRCCSGSSASNSSSGTDTGTGLSCFPGSKICPGPTPEEPGSRPSNKGSKPVKKEKKENSPAHVKTDNTTPRSKLDDVPLHRPLPQIGGTTSPSTTGHPDPDKRNITKLPPMEMTSESEEKKKKKKKKKKQSDGLANDGYDD